MTIHTNRKEEEEEEEEEEEQEHKSKYVARPRSGVN
jgi:hypothetical protein